MSHITIKIFLLTLAIQNIDLNNKGYYITGRISADGPMTINLIIDYINCYSCLDDCPEKPQDTPVVSCSQPCCFTAVTINAERGVRKRRRCVEGHPDCIGHCGKFETVYMDKNPNDEIVYCKSCNYSYCNREAFVGAFMCHQCTDCDVSNDNNLVVCKMKCCYIAYVGYEGRLITIRGCSTSKTCGETCADVSIDIPGVESCGTCETNGCNKMTINEFTCYQCNGCSLITSDTILVRCYSKCCYEHGFNRGCVVGDCNHYCNNKQDCRICKFSNCNHNVLDEPFKCYECTDCNEVTSATPQVPCRGPLCCYIAYINSPVMTIRGCSKSPDCTNTCDDLKNQLDVISCSTCYGNETTGCNHHQKESKSDTDVVHCYQCGGNTCNTITKDTPRVKCASRCCYVATIDGPGGIFNKRRCASGQPDCSSKCDALKNVYSIKNPHTHVVLCETCRSDKCNKLNFQPTMTCYTCKGCDRVNSFTPTIQCASAECCYRAYLKDESGMLGWQRGCARGNCGNACGEVAREHLLLHQGGSVYNCTVCKRGDAGRCNGETYTWELGMDEEGGGEGGVICYVCKEECNRITSDTQMTRCGANCCFTASSFGLDGWNITRGCARGGCSGFCKEYNTTLHRYEELVYCKICNESHCNKERLQDTFTCYNCWDCNVVTGDSELIECRGPKWCYTAIMKNIDDEHYFAVRGCDQIRTVDACTMIKEKHPNALFKNCTTCRKGEKSGCNNKPYTSNTVNCYECGGNACNTITKDTPRVVCDSNCCYSATIYGPSGIFHKRRCARSVESCSQVHCDELNSTYTQHHSNTKLLFCKTCDTDKCNNIHFIPSMSCYTCKRCNYVTTYTPTIQCPMAECCYSAVLNDVNRQEVFMQRGCAEWKYGELCENTCNVINREHMLNHPEGTLESCNSCKLGDYSRCNNDTFIPISTTISIRPSILCYSCIGRNCDEISISTPSIRCRFMCCYSSTTLQHTGYINKRDCGDENCKNTCTNTSNVEQIYCKTCTKNHCNKEKLHSEFKCYACDNCNIVTSTTKTVACKSPECCYIARYSVNNNTFVNRNCSDVKSCSDTCNNIKKTAFECITCNKHASSLCNGKAYRTKCYQCGADTCNTITKDTPVVDCPSNCCYSATITGASGVFNKRRCASGVTNCPEKCSELKKRYKIKRPDSKIIFCKSCSADRCNAENFNPTMACYVCKGCDKVASYTPIIICPMAECCYIAVLKDSPTGAWYTQRGCANWKICKKACKVIKKEHELNYFEGSFGNCTTCKLGDHSKCNNKSYSSDDNTYIPIANRDIPTRDIRPTTTTRTTYTTKVRTTTRRPKNTIRVIKPIQNIVGVQTPKHTTVNVIIYVTWEPSRVKSTYTTTTRAINIYYPIQNADNFQTTTTTVKSIMQPITVKSTYPTILIKTEHPIQTKQTVKKQPTTKVIRTTVKTIYPKTRKTTKKVTHTHYPTEKDDEDEEEDENEPHPHTTKVIHTKYPIENEDENEDDPRWHTTRVIHTKYPVENEDENEDDPRWHTTRVIHTNYPIEMENEDEDTPWGTTSIIWPPSGPKLHHTTQTNPPINCYSCKGKSCHDIARIHTVTCIQACCYSLTIYGDEGVQHERGCNDCEPHCNYFCMSYKRDLVQRKPGMGVAYCKTCNEDRCNAERLRKTINCYKCHKCNRVRYNTPMVECICPECCYTAVIKTHEGSIVSRDCRNQKPCSQTCQNVHSSKTCCTCKKGDGSGCNNEEISSIKCIKCVGEACKTPTQTVDCITKCCFSITVQTAAGLVQKRGCAEADCSAQCDVFRESYRDEIVQCDTCTSSECNGKVVKTIVNCYSCNNCLMVTSETQMVPCDPECCYVANFQNGDVVKRGCYNGDCNEACEMIGVEGLVLITCRTCGVGDANGCNNDTYSITDGLIRCYECKSCNRVNDNTPQTKCDVNCCYIAIANDTAMRGCIKNCRNACKELTKKDSISFNFCMICKWDNCNTNPYIPGGIITTTTRPTSIRCYKCIDCYVISTNTETCCGKCCTTISKMSFGVQTVTRGCSNDCKRACNCIKSDEYCKTCTTKNCNDDPIPINCYTCGNCPTISNSTNINMCETGCCSSIQISLLGHNVVARRCEKGVTCEQFCNTLTDDVKRFDPLGFIQYCRVCSSNKCNSNKFQVPTTTNVLQPSPTFEIIPPTIPTEFDCYKCYNCTTVSNETPKHFCKTNCCSTINLLLLGRKIIARRCEAKMRCENVCTSTADYVQWLDANGYVNYCKVCTSNRCNFQEFTVQTEQNQPNAINCYDCENCFAITKTTLVTKCASQCCYTAMWEIGDRYASLRGCAERNCDDYCIYLKNRYASSIPVYCKVCSGDYCNGAVVENEHTEEMIEKPCCESGDKLLAKQRKILLEIDCYSCYRCNTVKRHTKVVRAACCTTVQTFKNGVRVVVRGAEHGLECSKVCENQLEGDYCTVCTTHLCNNADFSYKYSPHSYVKDEGVTLKGFECTFILFIYVLRVFFVF